MQGAINFSAMLVAACANFLVWVLWYRRKSAQERLKESLAETGFVREGRVIIPYGLFAGASLVIAMSLAVMMAAANLNTFLEGVLFGVIVGFGFAAMAILPGFAMEMRPRWVYLLHAGAVSMGTWVMCIILASWN